MSSTERSRLFCIINTQAYLEDVAFNKARVERTREDRLKATEANFPSIKERGSEVSILASSTLVALKRMEEDCGVKLPKSRESLELAERQAQTGIELDFVNAEGTLLTGDKILQLELISQSRELAERSN